MIHGHALLPVMFLVFLMASIGVVFLTETMREASDVNFEEHRLRAFEVCETGLLRAEMELRAGTDPDGDGSGTLIGAFGGGTYDVTAIPVAGSATDTVLRSEGRHGPAVRRIEVGVRKPPSSPFRWAMFGKVSVKATGGSHTDAFDSDLGTWASQVTGIDGKGLPYAVAVGHVGSNGEIVTSGPIRGDATPGPFDVVQHPENVWGSTDSRDESEVLPDPAYEDFQAAFLANDNAAIDVSHPKVSYDPVTLELLAGGGAPITLTGGTYIFNVLKMTGGGSLQVTGPSVIYITNHFELSGGGVANLSGVPGDCLIYAHAHDFPSGSVHDKLAVKTSGSSVTATAIYAPTFHVEISGGGTLLGSLVGDTVVVGGGSDFHYDKALARLGAGGGGAMERLYWIER